MFQMPLIDKSIYEILNGNRTKYFPYLMKQFRILDKYNIFHYSCNLSPKYENGTCYDEYHHIKKKPENMPKRNNNITFTK